MPERSNSCSLRRQTFETHLLAGRGQFAAGRKSQRQCNLPSAMPLNFLPLMGLRAGRKAEKKTGKAGKARRHSQSQGKQIAGRILRGMRGALGSHWWADGCFNWPRAYTGKAECSGFLLSQGIYCERRLACQTKWKFSQVSIELAQVHLLYMRQPLRPSAKFSTRDLTSGIDLSITKLNTF